ncbi:phytoene desaturase family protein [Cumulibacter manganitolerans]|uniref:phytoene desaturase family protein n=1 Tax=Cumulibacter manganitolerans TaxID=1884992 RepID=UPI001297C712|nr:NAD(P)/FAD-dependent oxidoreductase [Cumulibacter manganitolerans]
MGRVVVVGSGPNGLSAAVRLARAGHEVRVLEMSERIGGGTRTSELTLPGLLHDDCSAFHPTGVLSPAFEDLSLEDFGLRWLWPEIEMAHPLDDGSAGLLYRDIDRTAEALGADGAAWKQVFGPIARHFGKVADDALKPVVSLPRHPFTLTGFGLRAAWPATVLARRFSTPQAKGLFAGVAAHQLGRLGGPLTSAIAVMLIAAGHADGWPVAEGGSRAITDALAAALASYGGTIETGHEVTDFAEVAGADAVLLSTTPQAAARIVGDRLPRRVARAYRRYRYGPGVHRVEMAIRGDVPWTNPECGKAGTVHLGGTIDEIVAAERDIVRGRLPRRPFVLVGQQYLADPSRSRDGINPLWAYAHVPFGSRDATEELMGQLERFAPGVSSQIVATHVRDTAAMETYNPNYVGGDIAAGANDARQVIFRPRPAANPYETGVPGVYLCSSATPPSAGVHGMCGWNAAAAALEYLAR